MLFKNNLCWRQTAMWRPCTEARARRDKETAARRVKRKEEQEFRAKLQQAREVRKMEPKPGRLTKQARSAFDFLTTF